MRGAARGVQSQQLADGGRPAERADDARRMPAARTERRILRAKADPHGRFQARGNGGDECAAVCAVALGDG